MPLSSAYECHNVDRRRLRLQPAAQIHYGRASLSPVTKLPAYFVFGRSPLGISECAAQLADYAAAPLNPDGLRAAVVLLDQPLLWALPELRDSIAALRKAKVGAIPLQSTKARTAAGFCAGYLTYCLVVCCSLLALTLCMRKQLHALWNPKLPLALPLVSRA